jgi:hypothetical protein
LEINMKVLGMVENDYEKNEEMHFGDDMLINER